MGNSDCAKRCSAPFAHLTTVATYVKRLGCNRDIYLHPLGNLNAKLYRGGILFQSLYKHKKKPVFAVGGRYDQLINEHRPPIQKLGSECHAVGFNFLWDNLWGPMSQYLQSKNKKYSKKPQEARRGHWATRRVGSYGLLLESYLFGTDVAAVRRVGGVL